jgi:xanthine/uracil permease
MMLVPFAVLLGCMLAYALLLVAFRAVGREEWFETPEEFTASRPSAPFRWVRTFVHRLLPPTAGRES